MAVYEGAMKADSGEMTRMAWARLELLDFVRTTALHDFMDDRRLAGWTPQEAAP